ncbi:glycosyltransferase, partial [Flavobacteriaceae bacterium]|nr:glycosyltransferase [Flavobacteriaceae bacterium]
LGTKNKGNVNRKMAELANDAAVVINFTRATHGCFHTMKTFELPAAGACVLSNYSEEQDEFYPTSEFEYFNTKEELKDQLQALLAEPHKILKIKKAANQYSKANSYHNRLNHLLKYLNEIE